MATLTTEAKMVLDALESDVVRGVIALAAGLAEDHVRLAVQEISEAAAS